MFYRTEKGSLGFKRLEFEVLMADIIEGADCKNEEELTWVTSQMCSSLLLAAYEHARDEMGLEDWEDPYAPCY